MAGYLPWWVVIETTGRNRFNLDGHRWRLVRKTPAKCG